MNEKRIAYWKYFIKEESKEKRKKLQDKLIQEIIYNLIIVYGPQSLSNITMYFGSATGGNVSKRIRENLKILTYQNWGPDPLIKIENGRYVLNDTIRDDMSD
jgi:hypothetical protein